MSYQYKMTSGRSTLLIHLASTDSGYQNLLLASYQCCFDAELLGHI